MKLEIICRNCGQINRSEVPIPSTENGIDLYCKNCETILISFFDDKHYMGIAIGKWIDQTSQKKVIKE